MRTVRKLSAALACTALLSVVGATTAGAAPDGHCTRVQKLSERIEAQKVRVEARAGKRAGAAAAGQNHKQNLENKLQDKLATLQARCSG